MSIRAFRFQLRPKPGTSYALRRFAGACRGVVDRALGEQQALRAGGGELGSEGQWNRILA